MTAVMQGVRVLEVAEHTFVPAASALLADWGAEVIKIEHVERGDAMRGLASSGIGDHRRRRPRAARALEPRQAEPRRSTSPRDEGLDILYKLAATCDVFLTNKLPSVRTKLKIDVDDIRAHNPDIIYVRGTGQGEHGPDADKGSYDSLAYWCRAGVAMGVKQPEDDDVPPPPAPAFGDSIGAMTIAGGIMGALFHRERTGEATTVDVSLLGVGMWSMGAALALSLQHDTSAGRPPPPHQSTGNPLSATYTTKDGQFVSLSLPAGGQVLARGLRGRRPARAGRRRALRRRRPRSGPTPRGRHRAARRCSPSSTAERVARAARRPSPASGRWCRTRWRPPPTRRRSPTATCRTARRADGTPFKLAAAPVAVRRRGRRAAPGAGVQRARRRDPRPTSASTGTPSST